MSHFNPAEFRAGWRSLLGAMLGLATSPTVLIFYSFGAFIKELQGAFGWTRAETSIGFGLCQVTIAVATPFVGTLMDRYGVRRPLAVSLVGASFGFALVSATVSTLPMFLTLLVCTALVASAGSPVAYTRVVNQAFRDSRGLALGIALTGTGVASFIAATLTTAAIARFGWRGGYLALAVLIFVAMPLILWLLRPAATPAMTSAAIAPSTTDPTFRDVIRTRVFWQVLIACALHAFAVAGLVTHFQPLLTDSGLTQASAAAIAGSIGFAIVVGRVVTGALLDWFFAPRIVALLLVFTTAGCLTLLTGWAIAPYIAVVAIGFSVSTEVDILSYLTARYFGMRAYGSLYGTIFGTMLVGSAVSAYLAGAAFDHFGNYDPAVIASAALMVVVILLLLLLPPFPKETATARSG